jgi:hypothetical protein
VRRDGYSFFNFPRHGMSPHGKLSMVLLAKYGHRVTLSTMRNNQKFVEHKNVEMLKNNEEDDETSS